MLAVDRAIKPRNMNFAKVDRRWVTNREGAFVWINMVMEEMVKHKPKSEEIISFYSIFSCICRLLYWGAITLSKTAMFGFDTFTSISL